MTGTKQFILGVDKIPDWFNEQSRKGRVKVTKDEVTDTIESVTILGPTKNYKAYHGDTIVMLKSGMTVIPKDVTKKYGEKPIKKEEE